MRERDLILRPPLTATPVAGDDPLSVAPGVERDDDRAREALASGVLVLEYRDRKGSLGARVLRDRRVLIGREPEYWITLEIMLERGSPAVPVVGPLPSEAVARGIAEGLLARIDQAAAILTSEREVLAS